MKELYQALAKAQGAIEGAARMNTNPHFKSKYADLASVWDACRKELSSNGLSVMQFPVTPNPGTEDVALLTILAHSSGESMADRFGMKLKDPTNPQALGSALTYMRRYALMAVVGIAPEDDDANSAVAKGAPQRGIPPLPAKEAGPPKDWQATMDEAMEKLSKCKTDPEKRELYSVIRHSAIDEPHKTALLTMMHKEISGKK